MPTLHEVSGYVAKESRILDGVNLMPVLRGERATIRDWTYCWYGRGKDELMVSADLEVTVYARTVRHKLYRSGQFFDMARDPMERQPLKVKELDAAARSTRQELSKVIADFDVIEASR